MKWSLSALLIWLLLSPVAVRAQSVEWPMVTRSMIIVAGTAVALDPDDDSAKSIGAGYVGFRIERPVYLKQIPGVIPNARPFRGPTFLIPTGQPRPPTMELIYFLTEDHRDPDTGTMLYDLTEESLDASTRPFSEQPVILTLMAMVENTAAIEMIEQSEKADQPFSEENETAELVRGILAQISADPADPERQKALVRKLDSGLLMRAFYYLVYFLDDLRPFPAESLTVEVKGQDGRLRDVTYRPELMMDAVDILLMRLTSLNNLEESLSVTRRFLNDHPSDFARKNAVKAWKAHLGRFQEASTIYN